MKLLAKQPLRHGGQDYQPGDEFEASDRDGKLLKAIRKAQDAPEAAVPAPTPPVNAGKTRKPKKSATYQTRRLMAKD